MAIQEWILKIEECGSSSSRSIHNEEVLSSHEIGKWRVMAWCRKLKRSREEVG